MADHKSKADFNAMSVAELKKYLQERGISASGYLKTSLVEIASAVEKIGPQIELLFSVWCLTGFLSEELISDYH